MKMANMWFVCSLLLLGAVYVNSEDPVITDKTIARAVIESCPGCRLNKLHEVKSFIYDDVPLYENVEFKRIGGAPPDLVFLNKDNQEIQRIDLTNKNREECNKLLTDNGFVKKTMESSESSTKKEL